MVTVETELGIIKLDGFDGKVYHAAFIIGKQQVSPVTYSDRSFNRAIDGMEALLMSLAATGIDVTTNQFQSAILSAIEGVANNL